ncbi:hypothetical protein ACS0TY_002230 [Phlomoides rotata]
MAFLKFFLFSLLHTLSYANIDQNQTLEPMITQVCNNINNQDSCLSSIQSQIESHDRHSPAVSVLKAALRNTINEAISAIDKITTFNTLSISYREQLAIEDCKELLDFSVSELAWSLSEMNKIHAGFKTPHSDGNLKAWLSAALSNQDTCLEGFEGTDRRLQRFVRGSLSQVTQLIGNVLTLYTQMHSLPYKPPINTTINHEHNYKSPDFPAWMAEGDKELLVSSPDGGMHVDAVVALDGSGRFRSIAQAIIAAPNYSKRRYVIYVKKGVYNENIDMKKKKTNIMMVGDGIGRTIISGNRNFMQGWTTFRTATVAVQGDDFIARDIGFENSAGAEKHQAVALRVSADKAIFYNCHMDGYQDTLYVHTYRQFYRDCVISGTIDFIFGDSAAVFQGCTMLVRKPLGNQQNIVTAQGRKDLRQPTGLVIQNCTFAAHPELQPVRHEFKSYLGRPWKEYSRTIIMESFLDDLIHPDGWLPWNADFALETLFYTEFNNRGPASPKAKRVKWGGVKELPSNRIQRFTASAFLDGNRWIPATRVPYAAGFIFPVPKEDPNIKYSPVVPEENKDLGLTTNIDKSAFDALKPNITTPPPTPLPTPPVLESNIAAAPAGIHPEGSVVSPAPLGAGLIPETGDVIIDLSPSPIPAPISESEVPTPAPISTGGDLAASPSGSTPQSGLAASPSLSPSDSTPQSVPAVSPSLSPSGGSAPPPQAPTDSSPISPTGASDAAATSTPTSAPAPQSSNPLAGAPSNAFTA